MSGSALVAEHLTRVFGRDAFPAVTDVSLSIDYGHVHALLGPNGAGKTTTVRMCSTLLKPSLGSLTIGGIDAVQHPERVRRALGLVLGGELGFYSRASARDNLLFFADVAGVASGERRIEVRRVLERVELADRADTKVGEFSRGMRQRLHIARALLGHPRLLLLDEPTTGLDPEISLSIRDLIGTLASDGVAILLTSHSMVEIEELATEISVIGAGSIAVHGSVRDITGFADVSRTTTATLPASAGKMRDAIMERIAPYGTVSFRPKGSSWNLTVYWSGANAARSDMIGQVLEHEGVPVPNDLFTRAANLEDAYLALADRLKR